MDAPREQEHVHEHVSSIGITTCTVRQWLNVTGESGG